MRFLAIMFVSLAIIFPGISSSETRMIPLKIAGYKIFAEVAHTELSRSQGLMYREWLQENAGMLFVFPEANYYSMWMKDTYIPLSVAFIDEYGVILNIANMLPETLIAHDSSGMAKYALEMNLGWFSARKIAAGAQVGGWKKRREPIEQR